MRIKASTLIESIVALTIIAIIFGAALVTFSSVTSTGNARQRILAHEVIQNAAVVTKDEGKYLDEQWEIGNVKFSKKVEVTDVGLLRLSIVATGPNGRQLDYYDEYLINDGND